MTRRANQQIRQQIKDSGFYAWQVASEMEIHFNTLSRKLRKELGDSEKAPILEALAQLSLKEGSHR